jgi:hypothetical protein
LPSREPGPLSLAGTGLVLGGVLVTGLALIELFVDAPFRATAAWIVAGLVLGMAALRVRGLVRRRLGEQARSGFEAATLTGPAARLERARVHSLADEIRFSTRSQRYFDGVFWPQLCRLSEASSGAPPSLPKPPGRSFGRGPSLAALESVIAAIEARR